MLYPMLAVFLGGAASQAAVLQTWAGPITTTGGGNGTTLVDTTNDTGDWITAGGYDTGTATIPLYFTFTIEVTNNAGTFGSGFFTGFALRSGTTDRLAVGNNWLSSAWGGFSGTGSPGDYNLTGSPAMALNTPVTFVLRLDQSANSATIWMNPNLNVAEGSQPAGNTTNLTNLGLNDTFANIQLRTGNSTSAATYSNMSVANSTVFVPEPSAALLGGIGLLGLLRRRR